MKAKTRFLKMFSKLPSEARENLAVEPEGYMQYSLTVIAIEVKNNTELGKRFLKELGYKDD